MISRPQAAAFSMPDIAHETRPRERGTVDWVGMDEIELGVLIPREGGAPVLTPARATAFVDLVDPDERGIHMSRLFLALDRAAGEEALNAKLVGRTLREFVERHEEMSTAALLRIEFELLVRRKALASRESGWRRYPVSVTGILEAGQLRLELGATITYSSTCPCSAALARQLIQDKFREDFTGDLPLDREAVIEWLGHDQGIVATPHSQRSTAEVRVQLRESADDLAWLELIDLVEDALQTPVQAAVKREDEQAFALRNGQNLMFCEDAGRQVRHALESDERFEDFWARATHEESLHPHDAVSVITKGRPGGFAPTLRAPEGIRTRVHTDGR